MGFYRVFCRKLSALFLGSALVLVLVALRGQDAHVSPRPVKLAAVDMSCEEIVRIGHWSERKFGGLHRETPSSDKFRNRALGLYLEKLDPHKILLTRAEVESFEQKAKPAWTKFVEENRCDFFQGWATQILPALEARLQSNLKALPIESLFPVKLKSADDAGSEAEPLLPRFTQYAKSEAELSQRLKKISQRLAEGASEILLDAYAGDKRKLIEDSVGQTLFGDSVVSPKLLLIKAYLGAIDPYSTYFSSSEFEDFYHDLAGGTSGVGVKVRGVPSGLLIEKIVNDSPAERCKSLGVGDIITNIDGIKISELPAAAAKHLLKGAEDTKIRLQVRKGRAGAIRVVELKRKHFSFEDARVSYKLIDSKDLSGIPAFAGVRRVPGKIAVIEIPSFYGRGGMNVLQEERSSAEDLKAILEKLLDSNVKLSAVVLDLRGNPGGFLEEAVSMAGYFIGDKPVVAVVENHHRRVLRDGLAKPIYTGPLVLLTDSQSASASEVLAGALKDHQRALVVGAPHTYGKGSVQKLFHLEDELSRSENSSVPGGVVKLTTSIFYSPLGHSPANGGVLADITLPEKVFSEEEDGPAATKYGAVTDQAPFIDEASQRELQIKQKKMQLRLTALEKRSEARTKDIQALIDTTFKKALGIRNKPEPEEYGLAEAVAIASDFVQMESPLLSAKSEGDRVSSPSVASPRMGE